MHGSISLGNSTEFLKLKSPASFRVDVPTPGTPVQLLNSKYTGLILIQALPNNTGNVAIGDSAVVLTAGSENFIAALEPGQTLTLPLRDATQLYLDAETADDGVCITPFA